MKATLADFGSIASAVIAFIALTVSIFAFRKAEKFNKTADKLNRLLIEREEETGILEKKADLSANIYCHHKNSYRLKIFNKGKGRALNIRIMEIAEVNQEVLDARQIEQKFPHPILEQHQYIELPVWVGFGSKLRAHIKLIWDDDLGKNYEKELTPGI
jgi:hypothetical protein